MTVIVGWTSLASGRGRNRETKYGSQAKWYNGDVYHSKREALYAQELDLRVKAGDIQKWERQVRIPMMVNNQLICTYVCDFRVINIDGTEEYHEVKGAETDVYRIKRKLLAALYPQYKYVVIK